MRLSGRNRLAQRGVAVVTALLLTTLAVTIVASLFWQQQVQVRSIENQRMQLQKDWVMRGALDWASMILRASAKQSRVDDLTQAWAAPLAETRLDQYVEDGQANDDAGNAVLSGNIIDAQSRFNLNNLSANGVVNPDELEFFKRLLTNLRLPTNLATVVAQAIAAEQPVVPAAGQPTPTTSGNDVLPLLQADDLLSLPGFKPDVVRQLKDFVVLLPEVTKINVNTASAEVLAARFAELSLSEANTLVARRKTAAFPDVPNLATQMTLWFAKQFKETNNVDVSSKYFLVYGKIHMGRASLNTISLIQRTPDRASSSILWTREQ